MLVAESQGFDLQEIRLAQQTIDIDTQRMSRQLAVQTGTQAPKRVGVVLLNAKLPRQLAIHGLNQLTNSVMQVLERFWDLLFLDGLFFGNGFPKAGIISLPIPCRAGNQVKLNHRNRQTIDDALPIRAKIGICTLVHAVTKQPGKTKPEKTECGSQRIRCMHCGYKYTPEPKQHGYPDEMRKQAVQMYVDGINLRRIARHFGIHHRTVSLWVQASAASLPEVPAPKEVKAVEMDELFTDPLF